MEWQPIETAPKDGTEILGYSGAEGGHFVMFWYGPFGSWRWTVHELEGGDDELKFPTHWMPLPKAPK